MERFFNRIKQCRRVATRYDKLAANYLAFIELAAIRVWLRAYKSTPQSRCGGQVMKAPNLETMPSDDLWQLYEELGRLLAKQLTLEKRKLEQRLSQLSGEARAVRVGREAPALS